MQDESYLTSGAVNDEGGSKSLAEPFTHKEEQPEYSLMLRMGDVLHKF